MKKAILLSFSLTFTLFIAAQTHSWQWAQSGLQNDSNAIVWPSCTTTDAAGNVIETGYFNSASITFGTVTLQGTADTEEVYVVKYDPAGNVLWAACSKGSANQSSTGVATDGNGNVYVVGAFSSPFAVFGNDTIFQSPGPSPCQGCTPWDDGFLVKYDPAGNVIWAKKFGGSNWDALSSIVIDNSGDLYISAWFRSDLVVFDGITLHDSTRYNYDNAVLLKCDSSGNVIWARSSAWGWGGYIALDASANVIFSGGFFGYDTISLGGIKVASIDNVLSGATQDFFIAKFSAQGNVLWAKNTGLTGQYSYPAAVASDPNGNSILTGWFDTDSVNIGGYTLYEYDANGYNYFITKYDTSGQVLWAQGAKGDVVGNGVVCDNGGNIWVAGCFFTPSAAFTDYIIYNRDSITSYEHIFLAEYDPYGNVLRTSGLGGDSNDDANALAIDPSGNLYLSGYFHSDSVAFGPIVLQNDEGNYMLPFVAKYAANNLASISSPAQASDKLVHVFPNPSKTGAWMVQVSSNLLGSAAELHDVNGKLIYKTEISDLNTNLFVSAAGGVYLLTITSGDNRIIKKLVKL